MCKSCEEFFNNISNYNLYNKMKIKDLPKVIKDRAMPYIKKNYPDKKHRPKKLSQAFDWGETEEGSEYWCEVDSGNFIKAEGFLKIREMNTDAVWTHWSLGTEDAPFFLDEVLETKVNEPEVVSYKDEYVKIDPIVNSVIDKFLHRSRVGIEKYGTTLGRNDLSLEEWINHAQEEAMDLCLYLTKIKEELKNK
jgi:hypothetical protein